MIRSPRSIEVILVLPTMAVAVFVGLSCVPSSNTPIDVGQIGIKDTDHVLEVGDPTITVVEYGDFQCPFCGRFSRETFPIIKRDYVDSGKVRWVFRHFPLASIHAFAETAAEAAECASDQGMFWEYEELLFKNQSALTEPDLKRYAAEIGLDAVAFDNCLESGEKLARVREDYESGAAIGVPGTPSFIIAGRLYVGFRSAADFGALLDGAIFEGKVPGQTARQR